MIAVLDVIIPVLYAVSILVLLLYGGHLLVLSLVHTRNERLIEGPVPDPDEWTTPDGGWPEVTVQLPLYNEAEVASDLIDACAALDYPRRLLEIQVLDDSTDDTRERVARRVAYWQRHGLDIVHIHRTDRTGYKAGALQNGLRIARGDFIAIFDADFRPPPDFLRRMLHRFDGEQVGMVQARWGHINQDDSLLTKLQAFGLDAHFAIEQAVREQAGCFMNFNGTAGVWRRACIEEAGGWTHDTLTEDLDLSYRAQLRGWTFRYVPHVAVPAELPPDLNALRTQQFRWTKGAVETALKLLRRLWASDQPTRVKTAGTFHLTAHFAFPFILLAAITHVPLLWLKYTGSGPGEEYFALMGFGLVGFAGFFLAQVLAQRRLYPDWGRRIRLFPVFMAGSMGLALSNTHALGQALRGKRTAFVRTPKYGRRREGSWWFSRYATASLPPVVWGEAALALYCLAGLGVTVGLGEWAAVPFQAIFAAAFTLVTACNWQQVRAVRRAPASA